MIWWWLMMIWWINMISMWQGDNLVVPEISSSWINPREAIKNWATVFARQAQILLDDLESWTATPVTSYVAKQSPYKRMFFFCCVYRISIHVLSMYYRCFSATEGSKSPLAILVGFHLPYPSIILGGFHHFLPSHQHPRPPRPRQALSMLEDYWATDSVNPDRVRFRLKGPFAADRDRATNHWEYDHWDILGRSLGIFTPISQMISQWYSHTKHFNGKKSWDISIDYWPLTNPVHVQEGPDGLHSIMGYVGIGVSNNMEVFSWDLWISRIGS